MLWDDALEGFWLEKRRNVSPHTVSDYALTFTRFRDFVGGNVEFEEITTDQVRKFLGGLQAQGLSAKSVSNCWTALSSLWSWAERELEIKHVIRGRVARPRYHRPVVEPYTRTDIGALLNACAENAQWKTPKGKEVKSERGWKLRDRAIILVLVDTGIRAQELCDLVVKDYENKLGRLQIRHGKGNKSRMVFMGEAARKALWRYLADRGNLRATDPIFATRNNTAMDTAALRKIINRCAERAGVLHSTVHKFRHTFAITFLRNGGSVLELQRMLGHERLDTVRIYASLAEADLLEAQKRASPADNWRF
jgi:integrase/recombinase XerD